MNQEKQSIKRPKGLLIFATLIGVSALWTIKHFFTPDPQTNFFGQIIDGTFFKLYCVIFGAISMAVAVGCFKLKRWAYNVYAMLTAFVIINSLVNIIITDYETLTSAGWKLTDNNMNPFYIFQTIIIVFSILLFLWLHKYRNKLQ